MKRATKSEISPIKARDEGTKIDLKEISKENSSARSCIMGAYILRKTKLYRYKRIIHYLIAI